MDKIKDLLNQQIEVLRQLDSIATNQEMAFNAGDYGRLNALFSSFAEYKNDFDELACALEKLKTDQVQNEAIFDLKQKIKSLTYQIYEKNQVNTGIANNKLLSLKKKLILVKQGNSTLKAYKSVIGNYPKILNKYK